MMMNDDNDDSVVLCCSLTHTHTHPHHTYTCTHTPTYTDFLPTCGSYSLQQCIQMQPGVWAKGTMDFKYYHSPIYDPTNYVGSYSWKMTVYSDDACILPIAAMDREGNWQDLGASAVLVSFACSTVLWLWLVLLLVVAAGCCWLLLLLVVVVVVVVVGGGGGGGS